VNALTPAIPIPSAFSEFEIIGQSPAFIDARRIAAHVASRRCTIMIRGETGAGKEMLARYVHQSSTRADKPFIPVDCSSLSDGLFESELFGHVRGAFTGAVHNTLGFIRAAHTGTLFLDEIGELTPHLQAKLLRVLQERRVVPVGDTRAYPVDVRVVTATHRDLPAMVRAGTFRQDLFFRLNVVCIQLPPLRDRGEDIRPLAQHFLAMQAMLYRELPKTLAADAIAALQQYPWPGNVRELANVMEQAYVLNPSQTIERGDLPEPIRVGARCDALQNATLGDLRLLELERSAITEALRRARFNKTAASRLLGINIQRLNRRILRLGISLTPDAPSLARR
jgi:transcriptional regulator with PAS, ATPase and Fis domain